MKKLVIIMTAVVMYVGLMGCQNKDNTQVTANESISQVDESTAQTESQSQSEEESTIEAVVFPGELELNNVRYTVSDYWHEYSNDNGTIMYANADSTETFAIYVQNETLYTAEDMIAAYEQSITQVYGENYTEGVYEVNGYSWDIYSYAADNLINQNVCSDIYLYTDGFTTIYIENPYTATMECSGLIREVINSISIEE